LFTLFTSLRTRQVVNLLRAYMRRAGDTAAVDDLDRLADRMATMTTEDIGDVLVQFARLAVDKIKKD
jgi:hypothetical protein